MRIDRTWPGWPEWAATVTPHTVSWTTVGAVLVLMGVFRLLAEWQRRTTLVALMSHAPGGTVVIQQRGLGGPPMWIWVGNGPRPPVAVTPVLMLPRRSIATVLPPDGHRD